MTSGLLRYRPITSHHITSHHITSNHITSHHITSHQHHITSHHITSHHITSHHITSLTSHHITSHHITSRHVQVVAALVKKGADVNLRCRYTDMTPLMYAASLGAAHTAEVPLRHHTPTSYPPRAGAAEERCTHGPRGPQCTVQQAAGLYGPALCCVTVACCRGDHAGGGAGVPPRPRQQGTGTAAAGNRPARCSPRHVRSSNHPAWLDASPLHTAPHVSRLWKC